MIVKFAIELDAINESIDKSHINRVTKVWAYCGILVHPACDGSIERKIKEVKDQTIRKELTKHFKSARRKSKSGYRWLSSSNVQINWDDDLEKHEGKFEVAVLEATRADLFLEVPKGEGKYFGKVEGIRMCDIDQSEEFRYAEFLGSERIRKNKSINDLWDERFKSFAENSTEVVIVDQYAFRDDDFNGLIRFLSLLDRDSNGCNVTVYSTPSNQAPNIEEKLRNNTSAFNGGGIDSIEVRLFLEREFKIYAHDRHIRFDRSVFHIGRGMRVFGPDANGLVKESTTVILVDLKTDKPEGKENDLDKKTSGARAFCLHNPHRHPHS